MYDICVMGVYVDDIKKAEEFYCNQLGYEIEERYGATIIELKTDGVPIVLDEIQGAYPEKPCTAMGIRTENLEAEIERLKSNGVDLIFDTPQPFPVGRFTAFRDHLGNLIELLEFNE